MIEEHGKPKMSVYRDRVFIWSRRHRRPLIAAALALGVLMVPLVVVYVQYFRMVGEKLKYGPFADATNIYAASTDVTPGARLTREQLTERLRRSGYTADPNNALGYYVVRDGGVEIHPGARSYFSSEPALVRFNKDAVSELVSVSNKAKLERYSLEPELVTNIVGGEREKRRIVRFSEIPKVLVNAVTSVEDKRFFDHMGFDPFRLGKAAWVDLKSKRKEQGASTITMQLARNLWLDPEKNWTRKAREALIALILEQRLSKEEIFEFYTNQVYLGRHNTYNVNGFGEAARVYFSKELGKLTLPEAALLAGLIQRPSYFNPFEHAERAVARRNVVLQLMHDNGYITAGELAAATKAPLRLSPPRPDEGEAPYFIALLNEELKQRLRSTEDEEDSAGLQVYSSLDPELQKAATEAVRAGMAKVDRLVGKRNKGVLPQVALVALDPRTGEVKAVVGGRNYAESQLNHALAMRQPGSIFKPFVYAAALSTGLNPRGPSFTAASTVEDSPATFRFANQVYEPGNFDDRFMGTVTLKKALTHSLNVATVSVAEKVGYDRVVALARKAGLNHKIQPTPAMALGAYEATPLEMAGAYTVFANNGEYIKPTFVRQVRNGAGKVLINGSPEKRTVLDPRVNFLMRDMLQEVVRSGTAAGMRGMGVKAPAAGKTGTSRDGWFAGFTNGLLCVVWVGFDDNRELNLEGSKSALPIWAEFMKRAVQIRDVGGDFPSPPAGLVRVAVDPYSGKRASEYCPGQNAYFLAGTEPQEVCESVPVDWFSIPGQAVQATASGFAQVVKAPLRIFR